MLTTQAIQADTEHYADGRSKGNARCWMLYRDTNRSADAEPNRDQNTHFHSQSPDCSECANQA
jgi:hypothetical protein